MSKQSVPVQTQNIMQDSVLNRLDVVRQQEKEIVRGKFINHETPGGTLGFSFKKYKGDPIVTYNFKDGEIYSIPLMVARHLNTNCSYPSYNYKNDENGAARMFVSERIRRFSFQSLEFLDSEIKQSVKPQHSALPNA